MRPVLGTVRSKLMALVGLSSLVALAVVPLIGSLMRTELLAQIDDRVQDAEKAFGIELDDDIKDLTLAARSLARDGEVQAAARIKDGAKLAILAKQFHDVYEDFDVAFFDPSGTLLTAVGCGSARRELASSPELLDALKNNHEFQGVIAFGCEQAGPSAVRPPPAYVVAVPMPGIGLVLTCLPLDAHLVANAGSKLGVQIALLANPQGDMLEVARTSGFPGKAPHLVAGAEPMQTRRDDRFAFMRFDPPQIQSQNAKFAVVVSMDVSQIQTSMETHLRNALVAIVIATLIALMVGVRIANTMSKAVRQISDAQRKLQDQQYVKVRAMHTGDEIEDLAHGFNSMIDGLQERDKLRSTMGKYMTEQVVEHLLAGKVQLGGESLNVTVLFSDIRSFTTISEKMPAHDLVALLNEYFTEMVRVVMDEGGVVDKYIGDAIMAVFGAPVPKPDDAIRAVRAAIRMRKALDLLNDRLEVRGIARLRTGIGIHTGIVVAGNIGSDQRMEYTVIGDAVNLASRLESATKELHVDMAISEDTWNLVHGQFDLDLLKEITVKGREQPVKVYTVPLTAPEPPPLHAV